MVKIRLSEKYMLTSDSRQFILNKIKIAKETKKDKDKHIIYTKGEELLFPFAFFPSLEAAIKNIPDKIIINSDIKDMKKLIDKYKKITNQLLGIDSENSLIIKKRRK